MPLYVMQMFKCRCANYLHQRITGVGLMNGTWKHHMSLVHLMYPKGLHREYYRVSLENDIGQDCELVKYHYGNGKYPMSKRWVRCVFNGRD